MKQYTHLGWFGFCPIYVGGLQGRCPDIKARFTWLEPLLRLNIALQELSIGVCTMMDPDWTPTWKIKLTRKLV